MLKKTVVLSEAALKITDFRIPGTPDAPVGSDKKTAVKMDKATSAYFTLVDISRFASRCNTFPTKRQAFTALLRNEIFCG